MRRRHLRKHVDAGPSSGPVKTTEVKAEETGARSVSPCDSSSLGSAVDVANGPSPNAPPTKITTEVARALARWENEGGRAVATG